MDDVKVYPVLSRIRRSGVVYEPDGERSEIKLNDTEAAPLLALKCIGETDTKRQLKDLLLELIDQGKNVAELNMDDIHRLLGKEHSRGVRRKHVDAALAEIEKEKTG